MFVSREYRRQTLKEGFGLLRKPGCQVENVTNSLASLSTNSSSKDSAYVNVMKGINSVARPKIGTGRGRAAFIKGLASRGTLLRKPGCQVFRLSLYYE